MLKSCSRIKSCKNVISMQTWLLGGVVSITLPKHGTTFNFSKVQQGPKRYLIHFIKIGRFYFYS